MIEHILVAREIAGGIVALIFILLGLLAVINDE